MKATAGGRPFEADTWLGLVSAVLFTNGQRVSRNERVTAAKQLSNGVSAVVGTILIKPEGARE